MVENLILISDQNERVDSVSLVQKVVIEDNGRIPIDGYMWDATVDSLGRFYVVVNGVRGTSSLYTFNQTGELDRILDISGRGPGEFSKVNSIGLRGDSLFLFGFPEKMAVFSLNDLSLTYDELLDKETAKNDGGLSKEFIGKKLNVTNEMLYVRFENIDALSQNREIAYHHILENGHVSSEAVLQVNSHDLYLGKAQTFANGMEIRPPLEVPFNRHSITRFARQGGIYSMWSEDFLIKKYDSEGTFVKAFYYPLKKIPLLLSELQFSESRKDALQEYELPKTWPAVYTMVLDDKERMWVATIAENNAYYDWWVINQDGDLEALFRLSGDKRKSSPAIAPLIFIRDGYFYIRENSNDVGDQRLVKYKIEFISR